MLYRKAYDKLLEWKKQKKRRQNRKTTKIMKQKHCDGVSLSE